MKKYLKILGLVIVLVSSLVLYAQVDNSTHLTRLRVSSSPSTTTNTLTDGQVEVAGSFFALGDFVQYDASNDGNPTYALGSSAAEALILKASYASGTQLLEFLEFKSFTANGTADRAEFRFLVDETLILTVDDGGLEIVGGYVSTTANTFVGDQSVDGDLNFLGAQSITTTTGALTLNPAEGFNVVIATTDTLTTGPITSSSNYVLEGFTTGRSVLRIVDIIVDNAGDGGKIKLESTDVYNGDVNAAEDNLALDVAGTNFEYGDGADSDDNKIMMLDAGISGVPIAVLSSVYTTNAGGTSNIISGSVVSNNIVLTWTGITDGATTADLDALVDVGAFTIRVMYLTTL